MSENSTRLKMMKLYEILRIETDEEHPISRQQLLSRVTEAGLPCHPRTISRHIESLNACGYEVCSFVRNHEKYYYVPERAFSLPELKILIDAVQAASFITEKKSAELIDKIAALGGANSGEMLKRHMAYFNSRKHSNESILYNVDGLEEAIRKRKQVTFFYFHMNEKAERDYVMTDTGERKRYQVEPVALIYNADNYYLMAYTSKHPESTANYRIDRMDHLEVVEDSTLSDEAIARIDSVAEYTEQAFRMFGGELADVTLWFDRQLIGPVLDKFGEGTEITVDGDTYTAKVQVQVQVSPTFFGWLAQFGGRMRIFAPSEICNRYKKHLNETLEML